MLGLTGVLGSEALKIIEKAAPMVATALGSPVAGIVVSLLENAFGVPAEGLTAAIAGNADASVKLKALELQHTEALATIQNTTFGLENDDAKNARDYAIRTNDRVPMILSYIMTGVYIAIQFAAIYNHGDDIISARVQDIMVMIIGYYFGSKHSRIVS
jgi:hypothetical protein